MKLSVNPSFHFVATDPPSPAVCLFQLSKINMDSEKHQQTTTQFHPVTTLPQMAAKLEEEDDPPTLSSYALEALQDFLTSQSLSNEQTQQHQHQQHQVEDGAMPLFSEDWRMSQFWYSPHTAITLAQQVHSLLSHFSHLDSTPCVACISCPTLFIYLKKMYPTICAHLFEYDRRFEQCGSDVTFYDYTAPEDLPQIMKHTCQIVVADPPYFSEECLKKFAQTMQFLAQPGKHFMLLLTGAVQRERVAKLMGMYPCSFRPEHSNKLGNEYLLYTNFNPGEILGAWELEQVFL